jgi:general secretion pathway protein D
MRFEMKHPVNARAFAALALVLCLLAAPVGAWAKKGEKNFKRGIEAEKAQQWQKAAEEFALAVAANPSEMEFQLHYRRALFNASQKFMEQGRTLAERGDYAGAYNAFRQAYGYDPVNELAVSEMERVLRLQREKEGANGNGHPNGRASASDGSPRAVQTAFNAAGSPAASRAAEAQLPPSRADQLRVINFNGDLEGFVRKMAEEIGFNVIFDRDFPKRTVNVNLRDVTAARALDHIMIAQNLFFQKLDRRTILVADQGKRGQYQQLVLRTFYLNNVDVNEARTLIQSALPPNAGRTPLAVPNKVTNSITVRDTPENIRLIENLLASIDKDRAEVVMDVNIYEVSRTDLLQLGNQVGDAGSLGNLGGLNPMQVLVGGPNGRGGTVTGGTGDGKDGGTTKVLADAVTSTALATAIGGAFLLPATRLTAFQSRDNTRLLAHTQVHAFDNEQSTTRIGQKVPVQTASVSPTFGTVPATGGTTAPGATNGLFGGGFPVIQYQDTGLILKFTPQVFPNQDVQVKMEIESNDVIGGPNALTPTFSQRSVSGMARIPNNRTMLIASVAQDKESRGRQGLPLLGLIPVLGRLFSTPTRNDVNSDIVITVTPRVLRAPTVTPEDIQVRPSGTLQAPVSGTLEAMVHEAEREEQLAAARQLPTNASVQLPAPTDTARPAESASLHHAPAQQPAAAQSSAQPSAQTAAQTAGRPAVQSASQSVAQPADAEAPTFVPAPKILAAAAGASSTAGTAVSAAPTGAAVNTFAPVVHTEDPPPPVAPAITKPASSAVAAALPAQLGPTAELYVVSNQPSMRVGERQRLMIFVKTSAPLALAAATLKFDPRVLAVRTVERGSLFGGGQSAQPTLTQSIDPAGSLLALVAPAAGSPVSGMGVLLFVEVEAVGAGESTVGFDSAGLHLMGADGRAVITQAGRINLTVTKK